MPIRMPSINQLTGLPSELFGLPPEGAHHVREIAKRFWEIQLVLDKANAALDNWQASEAVRALPDYIAAAHDDGEPGRYTVEGYGRIEITEDGLRMVPQSETETEGATWLSTSL